MAPIVLNVMYGLCAVFGLKASVDNVKQLLSQDDIIDRIKNFDTSSMTAKQHMLLDKHIHHKDFSLQKISMTSVGAYVIADWLNVLHHSDAKHLFEDAVEDEELLTEYADKFKRCNSFTRLFEMQQSP